MPTPKYYRLFPKRRHNAIPHRNYKGAVVGFLYFLQGGGAKIQLEVQIFKNNTKYSRPKVFKLP